MSRRIFATIPWGDSSCPCWPGTIASAFEVFCYAQVPRPDEMTGQLQAYADAWRNIVGISDEQAAEMIRQDRIDILVDLAMHTANNRLLVFARKPAPVQVTYLGLCRRHRLGDHGLSPDRSLSRSR